MLYYDSVYQYKNFKFKFERKGLRLIKYKLNDVGILYTWEQIFIEKCAYYIIDKNPSYLEIYFIFKSVFNSDDINFMKIKLIVSFLLKEFYSYKVDEFMSCFFKFDEKLMSFAISNFIKHFFKNGFAFSINNEVLGIRDIHTQILIAQMSV